MKIETLEVVDILEKINCFGKAIYSEDFPDRVFFRDGYYFWSIVVIDDDPKIYFGTNKCFILLKTKLPLLANRETLTKAELIQANSVNQRNDLGKHEA